MNLPLTFVITIISSCIVLIYKENKLIKQIDICQNETLKDQNSINNSPYNFNIEFSNSSTNRVDQSVVNDRASLGNKIIAKTLSGSVEGKTINVFGKKVFAFLGIPYAKPPVGKLRFSKPEPIKWKGIKEAKNFSKMCPHQVLPRQFVPMVYITEELDENCLTLNIWTPSLKTNTKLNKLKTVMVWIHGGAFNFNSANLEETDGRVLALYGDVVVVTINYRVGALGFLNSGTLDAPGNMGLYDQSLALIWIKKNIKSFGGDSNKIVLFGQSAGAISIGILMNFNKIKNLFSRAILQSGGPLIPGVLFSRTKEFAAKFTKLANCSDSQNNLKTNPNKVVDCLKKTPLHVILNAEKQISNISQIAFVPTPDGAFKDFISPTILLKDKNSFANIKEILFGLVPDEGAWLTHITDPQTFGINTIPELKTIQQTREAFIKLSTEKIGLPMMMATLVSNSLVNGPETDTPLNNVKRLYTAIGDSSIACPTVFLADELVNRNKTVYGYYFNHRAKANKFGSWQGISHYEEIPFVFGYPLRKSKIYSKQDIDMSKRLMHIWSTFAKQGQPPSQLNLKWPKYNDNESYLSLQYNKSYVTNSYHERSCEIFKASFPIFDKFI